jgi:two-component system alkaline phosphatase synthesis response regulator PhoP
MKLLVVYDEMNILELMFFNFKKEGYEVDTAADGETALKLFSKNKYDLIVLDRMLPGMDGCDILKKVRSVDPDIPVIMLTAKSEEADKLKGFDLGADDYVTKPFSVMELKARVKAMLKRNSKEEPKAEANFALGGMLIDYQNYKLYIDEEKIPLTLKEFELIKLLTQNQSKVFSREKILEKIWGYEYYGETRTVDVHIRTLRKKIGDFGKLIKTIHGVGYSFDAKIPLESEKKA